MKNETKTVSTASAMQGIMQAPKAKTETKAAEFKVTKLFRPALYPNPSKELFAYTIAQMMVLGMFKRDKDGKAIGADTSRGVKKADFLSFWNTSSILRHHGSGAARIEEKDGKLYLTAAGFSHFYTGRVEGKNPNQKVDLGLVAMLARFMQTGEWTKNENGKLVKTIAPDGFSKDTVFVTIHEKV